MSTPGPVNSRIQFQFRCSAFGLHYYNCISRDFPTFEVCHSGQIEECPEVAPRWGWREGWEKPAGFDTAWTAFCAERKADYEAWKVKHAYLFTPIAS